MFQLKKKLRGFRVPLRRGTPPEVFEKNSKCLSNFKVLQFLICNICDYIEILINGCNICLQNCEFVYSLIGR